jgi:hypothetical protein
MPINHLLSILCALCAISRADDELVVYPPVPGLAASEHYVVRVHAAGGSEWCSAFAWETVCKSVEK